MCNSKETKPATIQPMFFMPIVFGVCAGIICIVYAVLYVIYVYVSMRIHIYIYMYIPKICF